jgi:hypothetical protein
MSTQAALSADGKVVYNLARQDNDGTKGLF